MDRFEQVKLRIKESTDLVALIQRYIPLQRRGRTMVALCPFHQEKTASFTVFPDTQHFKCFGCGQGGDVFSFVMEREGLSFRDAMEKLAVDCGVDTSGVFSRREPGARTTRDTVEVLATVSQWFVEILHDSSEGRPAREYLASRGLLHAMDAFGLGAYPPIPGRLREFARSKRLPFDVLETAGLLTRGGRSEPYLGRVMFPIVDERGQTVAFGGRVLPGAEGGDDSRPKYLNSRDSGWFNKRKLLFGLRQVKQSGERRVFVVEGYTDVIACHVAGFTGAVATLGTALTSGHTRLLERYATDGVVLLFDGDRAGRQAADRAFRELVHTSLPVRIGLLPEGRDPADLAAVEPGRSADDAAASREQLAALLDGAPDATTTWFRLLRQQRDLSVDANVERAAAECARILETIETPARREALLRDMARHLGLTETALRRMMRTRRAPAAPRDDAGSAPEPAVASNPADPLVQSDMELIACLIVDVALVRELDPNEPTHAPFVADLIGWLREALDAGRRAREAVTHFLFARCGDRSDCKWFITESLDRLPREREVRSIFSTLIHGRTTHFAKKKLERLRSRIEQAKADGDRDLVDRLTREWVALLQRPDDPPPPGSSRTTSY